MATVEPSVSPLMEVVEFLLSRPSYEQMVAFQFSPEARELVSELLLRNREATLSREERHELDQLMHLETLLQLLTAKARLILKSNHG